MSNVPITPGSGAAVATDELTVNLTGTVAKNGTATLTGTGTAFTTDLAVGQVVRVPGGTTEDRIVQAVASDTSLTVTAAFAATASGQTAQRVTQAQQVKLLLPTAGSITPAVGQQTMTNSLPVALASDHGGNVADGSSTSLAALITNPRQTLFNESSWDRQRGNTEFVLMSFSARTAGLSTGVQTNYNQRGVLISLNITVASGTGGLTLKVQGRDLNSGAFYDILTATTPVTTTGVFTYAVYPASLTAFTQAVAGLLPRSWRVSIVAGDASSYTYDVSASLLL